MLISRYACFQFRWLLCNSPTTGSIGSACQARTEADQIYGVLNLTESRLLWKVLCYKSVAVFIMSLCSFSECAFCVVKISISSWSLLATGFHISVRKILSTHLEWTNRLLLVYFKLTLQEHPSKFSLDFRVVPQIIQPAHRWSLFVKINPLDRSFQF